MADHYVQTVKGPGKTEVETRVYQDYVERHEIDIAADLVSNVYRAPIEAGDYILEVRAYIKTPANGTSPTMIIGDSADNDGYLAAADLVPSGSAGTARSSLMAGEPYAGGKQYPAKDVLTVTFGGTVAPTTGVVVVEVVKAGYPSHQPNYLIANR